jgi:hypothetical protein
MPSMEELKKLLELYMCYAGHKNFSPITTTTCVEKPQKWGLAKNLKTLTVKELKSRLLNS